MKSFYHLAAFGISLLLLISIFGCKKDIDTQDITPTDQTDIHQLQIDDSFNWNTTKLVQLQVETRTNDNQPLTKIKVKVFTQDPYIDGVLQTHFKPVFTGFTDNQGVLACSVNLATVYNKLYIVPAYIGLPVVTEVSIVNNSASVVLGGKLTKNFSKSLYSKIDPQKVSSGKFTYFTIGTWNSSGRPDYLTVSDVISSGLLADINASLPESSPLPTSHPQYLVSGNQANIVLKDSADVWVTFVHEGAGYKNVLGYYTYQKNNEPQTVNDLTDMTIIFPNTSFYGSGGMLNSGDKVYIGSFGANTVIGYFIIADGYNSTTASIKTTSPVYYSNSVLNPEADNALKQHMIMLNDPDRNLLILGFEDINRSSSGCDNDFNDAIFYVSVNPITAVEMDDVPEIDTPVDDDGDGVSNKFDDYPDDDEFAVNNYYPAEGEFGTLAFEDLWPAKGDYDFNDLVLDYQFNQITNSENKIVNIEAKLVVRAIGAGYHNGFGFQMDLLSSDIQSVTGQDLRYNYITLHANGTEAGQSKATIIPFDNAFNLLPPAGGTFVNTVVGNPYSTPDTQLITIALTTPKTPLQVGSPPYNPFLIVNKNRGVEVHLPGYPPTSLVNTALFGTEDDNTNLATANYYKSNLNLPWGMNLPSSFVYPIEKSPITVGHLKFGSWAQSNGYSFMDWYEDKLGYRDNTKLYSH